MMGLRSFFAHALTCARARPIIHVSPAIAVSSKEALMKQVLRAVRISLVLIIAIAVGITARVNAAKPVVHGTFDLVEATITSIHKAVDDGIIDSRQLVEMYLARIAAYDGINTTTHLNSFMYVNPRASQEAAESDNDHANNRPLRGFTHERVEMRRGVD